MQSIVDGGREDGMATNADIEGAYLPVNAQLTQQHLEMKISYRRVLPQSSVEDRSGT